MPKSLPSSMKPRVPGHEDEEEAPDDEKAILLSADTVDKLVAEEIDQGTDPGRIIVGGFSQGCAVSMVWGLIGRTRRKVGGVVCMSGYMPLVERIRELQEERSEGGGVEGTARRWFLAHGMKDMLVPSRLFQKSKDSLLKYVDSAKIEHHLYEGLSHSIGASELRDLCIWLEETLPP